MFPHLNILALRWKEWAISLILFLASACRTLNPILTSWIWFHKNVLGPENKERYQQSLAPCHRLFHGELVWTYPATDSSSAMTKRVTEITFKDFFMAHDVSGLNPLLLGPCTWAEHHCCVGTGENDSLQNQPGSCQKQYSPGTTVSDWLPWPRVSTVPQNSTC